MDDDLVKRLRDKVEASKIYDDDEELLDEAADRIEKLKYNAKSDTMWLKAYHKWCEMNGCAPSSSDLSAARTALGEKKDD
jgi:hypothetical protein